MQQSPFDVWLDLGTGLNNQADIETMTAFLEGSDLSASRLSDQLHALATSHDALIEVLSEGLDARELGIDFFQDLGAQLPYIPEWRNAALLLATKSRVHLIEESYEEAVRTSSLI